MSAIVNIDAVMRVLRSAFPRIEKLTMEDMAEPRRVTRAYNALLDLVCDLASDRPQPYIDFEDQVVTSGTSYTFRHGLNGRVRFWAVEWVGATSPGFSRVAASSDDNTLVVTARATGTVTLRVQRSSP